MQNALEGFSQFVPSIVSAPEENWHYYSNVRFQLYVQCKGERCFIADGGDTDWTQALLNNKKERFLISGFGSERFIAMTR